MASESSTEELKSSILLLPDTLSAMLLHTTVTLDSNHKRSLASLKTLGGGFRNAVESHEADEMALDGSTMTNLQLLDHIVTSSHGLRMRLEDLQKTAGSDAQRESTTAAMKLLDARHIFAATLRETEAEDEELLRHVSTDLMPHDGTPQTAGTEAFSAQLFKMASEWGNEGPAIENEMLSHEGLLQIATADYIKRRSNPTCKDLLRAVLRRTSEGSGASQETAMKALAYFDRGDKLLKAVIADKRGITLRTVLESMMVPSRDG